MGLLAGVNYDPATAVSKLTNTANFAMTALDTANLRLSFVAPANGAVYVRFQGVVSGGTTFPSLLFGILDGATVRGRQVPKMTWPGTAASTSYAVAEALFLVTGLTPGTTYTWDAAYACETFVTGTAVRYGGPNDTTAVNAWGGFAFEIWDTA